jgi:hypothetical protein
MDACSSFVKENMPNLIAIYEMDIAGKIPMLLLIIDGGHTLTSSKLFETV